MTDITLETIRAGILVAILCVLYRAGRKHKGLTQRGWKLIVLGFVLLLFGSIVDITDNFESLNKYVVIGDTRAEAFLEKIVGFLGGFVALGAGLLQWLPAVTSVKYLQESKAQKQAILDAMQASIIYINERQEILWANEAAGAAVGRSSAEMVGHKCYEFCGQAEKMCDSCPVLKVFKTKKLERTAGRRTDGRVWDESGQPVFDADGKLTGVIMIAHDISDREKTAKKLQKHATQLEQFNKLAVGRELRMIELKEEVDALLNELGREEKYKSDFEQIENKPLTGRIG